MVSEIDRRKGLSATAAAEVFWGLTPIYWKAVATVSTHELLALRVLWAIPVAVVLLTLRDAWGDVWRAVSSWHTLSALLLTAALIGCNWFAFLIAMENGQILQSSLGYFITPLVSILLGFVFLGERLHAVQWVAVALAAAGVANQILAVGSCPGSRWSSRGLSACTGCSARRSPCRRCQACLSKRPCSRLSRSFTWRG